MVAGDLRNRGVVFLLLFQFVRYLAVHEPWRFTALMALALFRGLLGPTVIAATGLAVARAPEAVGLGVGSAPAAGLAIALALVGCAFALELIVQPVQSAVGIDLGSRIAHHMRTQLLDATLAPEGIAHLEDPEVADEIERSGEHSLSDLAPMSTIANELGKAVTTLVAALGAALILATFAWWAPLLLIACAIATHLTMRNNDYEEVKAREENAVLERRADYFRDLALDPPAAKEIRLFGLTDFLAGQAYRFRSDLTDLLARSRRAKLRPTLLTVLVIGVADGLVLGLVGFRALDGEVSAAGLTVYLQATFAMSMLAHPMFATWWIRQGTAALPHLVGLPEKVAEGRLRGSQSAEGLPRREIRLTGLVFSYGRALVGGYVGGEAPRGYGKKLPMLASGKVQPDESLGRGGDAYARKPVLAGLDLTIPVGSSLAIVGQNGEGKTTLLKLLTRMYDPSAGAIEVDGIDLRKLDPISWRRQITVIFQDFVRYELSARENIAMGRPDGVERAAERAGALEFVEKLPAGFDTILSRQYNNGADLSGGQWQRIALARALRAADDGARVLILDEPTAALDVRAEAELFDRFLELTAGITTILVTHRLSSVRHADRIAVLEGGRIVEHGSHEELLAAEGSYAKMFRLQAERFQGALHG